jgi:hypothetical protein
MVTFLIASDRPITTESLDGVLLKSTTEHRVTAVGHADRIRRKAPEAIARANDRELAWLTSSAALLVAIVTRFEHRSIRSEDRQGRGHGAQTQARGQASAA